ncbi:MAG: TonB-dependent receptor [Acidobacteria bacterium]|nr:TonB-dependent receptor [Acidobacteriota bacterium]
MGNLSFTICLFSLGASTLFAQLDRGSLTGTVKDPTGAAVAGAKVTATHTETNASFSTATTDTGDYTLPALNIGAYRVDIEAPGFKRVVHSGVNVTSGSTLRLDFTVELGAVTESVQVQGQATALETETTRVATNLTTKLIEDLPLVVAGQIRNVFNLAVIAPEVKTANGYRIGGAQGSGWEMNMDGTSLTSASTQYQTERAPISSVPVDAIAEFTVESTGMKAEYGRAMGQISFVTKAGGNQLHGNLFEFLRNNITDARGFFAQQTPTLKQNDFGFTVGGPVYIPKVYNGKNRTFFFASYEGFRNRSGNTPGFNTVPLNEMYEGDFSGWIRNGSDGRPFLMPIYDPSTTTLNADGRTYSRLPFSGNLIPKGRFSSVASKYISFRPKDMVANLPGINRNYFRDQGMNVSPWNKFSIRGDHHFNVANHVSFLYMNGTKDDKFGPDGPPGLPVPFNGGSEWYRKNSSGRFSWDRTVTTRILNSLRINYQREAGGLTTINSLDPNAKWAEKLGLKNTPGPDRALTAVTFAGYTAWSGSSWGFDRGRDLSITNDMTYVRGSHTFKGGFFYTKDQWWGGGQHRPNGSFDFAAGPTAVPGDTTGLNGNGFASFLLGQATTWGLETPRAVIQSWKYYGGFFQDDWRVNAKLTLNLGLRYEYTSPIGGGAVLGIKDWSDFGSYGEPAGFMNFDPSVPNPVVGGLLGSTVYTGTCAECNGQKHPFDSYKKAWSPRFGLAYQMRRGTVLRMYAGKSYGAIKTTGGSTHFQGLILNSSFGTGSLPAFTYFPIDNGLPAWTAPPFRGPATDLGGTTYFWQKGDSGRPPEFYSWNLDLQHQLPHNLVASAGYTATRGVHLSSSILNINQMDPRYFRQYGRDLLLADIASPAARAAGIPIPYPAFRGSVSQALRPFPHYGDVATAGGQPSSVGERTGDSTYHALIVKLDKRYSSGLTLLSSYVFSKLFSNADSAVIAARDSIDHYNRKLQKALSWDDQTHVFRQAFSYELPFGKGKHWNFAGVADKVLGGWGLSGFLEYANGTPMSVGPGFSPVPGGMGNRVWINSYEGWRAPVAGEKFDPYKDAWFDASKFQVAPDGRKLTTAELNGGIGNATKNNPKLRTPWNFNENLSLAKDLNATERARLTLRFEAFNILNRVRWAGPDATVTSPTFGQVRGQSNDPRRMQAGIKFVF